jgi:hypothetical protein
MKRYRCPHCGNTNPQYISDNGCRESSPDFTLLCTKPCQPGESSFDDESWFEEAGKPITCGMQWEPNNLDQES